MLLGKFYEGMELHRENKIVYARFTSPHAVLSTSRANGGYREDLLYLFNHQACEPSGHGGGKAMQGYTDPDSYLESVCAQHGIGPASRCASLSTAANMRLCDVRAESYKDLTVVAAVTAGVEGNAGRAGDPASGYEGRNGYEAIPRWKKALEEAHKLPSRREGAKGQGQGDAGAGDARRAGGAETARDAGYAEQAEGAEGAEGAENAEGPHDLKGARDTNGVPGSKAAPKGGDAAGPDAGSPGSGDAGGLPPHGTINTLLFVNLPVTPGCLARLIMTATEAKTAALQELNVNSRYSEGLATGTGTDQIAVASLFVDGFPPLSSAGKHSKLGELTGRLVKAATKEALLRQNSLTPELQCSVKILVDRLFEREGIFRTTREELAEMFSADMDPETAELFLCNSKAAFCDPATAAGVAAMMHLRDQFSWGTFPLLLWPEIMSAQAALLGAAASGDFSKAEGYRKRLEKLSEDRSREGFVRLLGAALAMGYSDKWEKGV
ncbi:MAG: adenosylcobinamide amidohydrolase [Deltaproteobacteria bacterium]|jgi:adenosylcobinamide amidohydrolase|nr:adenosylcobinamide amidohydrolase [Deltaproteobacteria bacterium]